MLILNRGKIGELKYDKNGKAVEQFYGEDIIYSEGNYKDGEWIFYHPNGKFFYYKKNGRVEKSMLYRDGVRIQ